MTIEETLLHDLNAKYQEYVQASRKYIEHKSIDECVAMNSGLVDRNRRITKAITSLREELKEYQETVENRDKTIALRGDVIKKQNVRITDLKADVRGVSANYRRHDAHLKEKIEGLEAKVAEKDSVIDMTAVELHNCKFDKGQLTTYTTGLEAELSARKQDSDVLMKVVEVIKADSIPNAQVPCMICGIVDDYLDETTNITEYNISTGTSTKGNESENAVETKVFEIEYPVDRSRTVHLQRMRIAEQSETIKRLVKEVKELRDADQITVNVPTTEQVQPVIDEIMRGVRQQGCKVKVEFNVPNGVFLELP